MITALSSIGFGSPNTAAWTPFGPEVLGAQLAEPDPDGAIRLAPSTPDEVEMRS
jgi:hypothetical protein